MHLDRYNRSIECLHRQKWKSSDRGALLTPGLRYLLATYATSSTPYWLREKVFGCCWYSHWDRPVTSIYRTRPRNLIRETHEIASEPDLPIPDPLEPWSIGAVPSWTGARWCLLGSADLSQGIHGYPKFPPRKLPFLQPFSIR